MWYLVRVIPWALFWPVFNFTAWFKLSGVGVSPAVYYGGPYLIGPNIVGKNG